MNELLKRIENIERKMEDIEKEIKELKNKIYYTSEGIVEKDSLDDWKYDEGTDEKALLNNIKHPEKETIGKIYYIQAYYHNSDKYTEGTPIISQDMPYMVIGVNHDDTENTVDLMSLVAADYRRWYNGFSNSWKYGKYSESAIYNWLSNTCPNGYSSAIQSKMCYMTERWREATYKATGELQTRQTKCKILNPVELFGYSSSIESWDWQYASNSDYMTDFDSKYGSLYPAFVNIYSNGTSSNTNRRVFHDKAMNIPAYTWTNSWLAYQSYSKRACCFIIGNSGLCDYDSVSYRLGIAPVIRLADKPDNNIDDKLKFICSYTTRPMRDGEVDGREHIFISNDEANKLINENKILALTIINEYRYFTLQNQLKDYNAYIIDPYGIDNLVESNKLDEFDISIAMIYVYTSKEIREDRYISRKFNKYKSREFIYSREVLKEIQEGIDEFDSRDKSESEQFDSIEAIINLSSEKNLLVITHDEKIIVMPTFVVNNDKSFDKEYYLELESKLREFIREQRNDNPNTLFCLVGRTASGKDTIAKMLSEDPGEYIRNL